MTNIVAILAARMASTRLYGKQLVLINGTPVLGHLIERLQSIREINSVIVATSSKPENKAFQEYAEKLGIGCFVDTGDEEDVLGRFVRAAAILDADHIVRSSGEVPIIYLEGLPKLIRTHLKEEADLTFFWGMPLGATSEIISVRALRRAYFDYGDKYHNAMVTLCMNEHLEDFKVVQLPPPKGLERPELRMAVDGPSDVEVMAIVFRDLQKPGKLIEVRDVVKYLDLHPKLREKNINVPYKVDTRIWS